MKSEGLIMETMKTVLFCYMMFCNLAASYEFWNTSTFCEPRANYYIAPPTPPQNKILVFILFTAHTSTWILIHTGSLSYLVPITGHNTDHFV